MDYQKRVVDDELDEILRELPAVSLEGPRGVGKTATAERRANSFFYLDDPAQRAVVEADTRYVLSARAPVLIDEWQRVPAVWDAVRRAVDRGAPPGSFLLTGSSSPQQAPTHSGAGRIVRLRMRPMSLAERRIEIPSVSLGRLLENRDISIEGETSLGLVDYVHEMIGSGFPGIRRLSGRPLRLQLDGYVQRIIDTDFQEQGLAVRRPEVLSRWLTAYAAATATTASFETIRDAATGGQADKPSKTTTQPYRAVLERLWILDEARAWLPSRNRLLRLLQAPKHHLADPALAVRLLGMDAQALLTKSTSSSPVPADGTLLGNLFESLVALCLRVYAQRSETRVFHFRQHSGRREVDYILERPDGRIVAVEVKLSSAIKQEDVRNLLWLREQLGDDLIQAVVIHTGPTAYRRKDGVAVVPASLLSP